MWTDELQTDYKELLAGTSVAPLDDHFLIALTGEDRASFLHNFCTADIKKLTAGQCCEAFILNGKGKTMAFLHVMAFVDAIWLVGADKSNASVVIEHLDRYIIREDVQLSNLTDDTRMFFSPNEGTAGVVGVANQTPNECSFRDGSGRQVRTAAIEIAGFGAWFAYTSESLEEVVENFRNLGANLASPVALNSIRIEKGTPWSGSEADDSNLPQELQRDEKAISFNKGCYLGQETVARLDALGRVNQLLVRVQLDQTPVAAGTELRVEDKTAGRITSVAWSPESDQWIGFAFVRRAYAATGSRLHLVDGGTATVVA